MNLASSHHPAHGATSQFSIWRGLGKHAQTQTHTSSLRVLWQNGGNHHTGGFGTLSATVAPFEEWEKGKKIPNLRYRISMLLHFGYSLPPPLFFHNIPWV